ncbi:stemmadenine O-acetyltransferase-like [Andrographis paniculata]|uniref:stemmadenine O-acetyltransferase-like n=1 Tax=Andrographis paniculata TaxID=175694 RepID=UPI0021E86E0C|nr:stemmadenine O-acetyltransferase-like [Andrographis paniculata]
MVSDSVSSPNVVMISPSSPTPPHLRNLQLSFLDQLSPPMYIHIILHFDSSHSQIKINDDNLRRSLSEALAVYYPLAGRLRDGLSSVDCNDAGAEYVEAHFPASRISDVIQTAHPEDLRQYVPAAPSGGADIPLAVQVSFFAGGGLAIGVCLSHRIADATSMVMFISTWAAACRADAGAVAAAQPSFSSASRFPPADFSRFFPSVAAPPPPPPAEKIITRRFVFNKWKVSALRQAASGPLMASPATRVEAVSAFLWRHFIESAVTSKDKKQAFAATHAVDIRRRASPPLPRHYFGNACARAMAVTESPASEFGGYYELVLKLRETISKADSRYVGRLENGDEFLTYYSENEENDPTFRDGSKTLEICSFTSWHRLPGYEVDYGWGKPAWVSIMEVPLKNLIFLLGTKSGDGIEAWVNMREEDMAAIKTHYDLLQTVEDMEKHKNFNLSVN